MKKKMLLVALALLSVTGIKSAENNYRGGYAIGQQPQTPPNPSIPSNLLQKITKTPGRTYNSQQIIPMPSWGNSQSSSNNNQIQQLPESQQPVQYRCLAPNTSNVFYPGDTVTTIAPAIGLPESIDAAQPGLSFISKYSSQPNNAIVFQSIPQGMISTGSTTIKVNPNFKLKKNTQVTIYQTTLTNKNSINKKTRLPNTSSKKTIYCKITVAPRPKAASGSKRIISGGNGEAKTKNTRQAGKKRINK